MFTWQHLALFTKNDHNAQRSMRLSFDHRYVNYYLTYLFVATVIDNCLSISGPPTFHVDIKDGLALEEG